MMVDPSKVTFRRGSDSRYLNIDYADTEIGHLHFAADGRIDGSWAVFYADRPLVELIARCQLECQASRG